MNRHAWHVQFTIEEACLRPPLLLGLGAESSMPDDPLAWDSEGFVDLDASETVEVALEEPPCDAMPGGA